MSRVGDWFEKRLPVAAATRRTLDEEVPGGARFAYTLGSATLLTFIVLAVTGIAQLFFYVPTTAQAYDSVNYLRFQVPLGWLVHGLHFWAATVMVALVLLHLAQAFLWGAFKKPRELTWILGVLLFLGTIGAFFTGGPLPWDEKGFWAAKVGSGIAGGVPLLGGLARQLMFGGATVGQLTLSHLFAWHVALFPLLIAVILWAHVAAFRRGGAAGPVNASGRVGAFWPDQVLRDLIVFAVVLGLLVWLSATLMTPVTGPADPIDATYVARPEWSFLFLFQTLKYLPGSLEPLGTVGVPLLGTLLLLGVPWLDRSDKRSPAKRPVAMAVFAIIVVGLVGLSLAGANATQEVAKPPSGPPPPTPAASINATPPGPGPSLASHAIGGASHGETLFVAYCQQCHGARGVGGVKNPGSSDGTVPEINPMDPEFKDKDPQKFVDNIDEVLQNGSVPDGTPRLSMPSFGNTYAMSQPQIADVEAYVLQINGVQRAVITRPGVKPLTFLWFTLIGMGIVVVAGGVAIIQRR
jgi:ubiquinol-cytochrome c reductase cytochrome b subunit